MNIEELTVAQVRQINSLFTNSVSPAAQSDLGPWKVGENYFIRTVTHHLTGKLMAVGAQELSLRDAAWIADDGRFAQAVATAQFSEVEPFPDGETVIVGRASIIDAVRIGTLPRVQI